MALEFSGRSTEVDVDNRVSLVNLENLDAERLVSYNRNTLRNQGYLY